MCPQGPTAGLLSRRGLESGSQGEPGVEQPRLGQIGAPCVCLLWQGGESAGPACNSCFLSHCTVRQRWGPQRPPWPWAVLSQNSSRPDMQENSGPIGQWKTGPLPSGLLSLWPSRPTLPGRAGHTFCSKKITPGPPPFSVPSPRLPAPSRSHHALRVPAATCIFSPLCWRLARTPGGVPGPPSAAPSQGQALPG